MLDSEPVQYYCCVPYPLYPTKVHFINETDWDVRYELIWYKEKELLEAELGANGGPMGGNVKGVFNPAESVEPEEGYCVPKGKSKSTVMRGYKYFRLKYKFIDVTDYLDGGKVDAARAKQPKSRPEIKNFSIYDKIIFKVPPKHLMPKIVSQEKRLLANEDVLLEKLDSIETTVHEIHERVGTQKPRKLEKLKSESPLKSERRQEEEQRLQTQPEKICASLHKHMCSSNGIMKKCEHCKYSYCSYHYNVNNSMFSAGGHMCH